MMVVSIGLNPNPIHNRRFKMTWNYRITKIDGFYSIREVYYDEEGKIESWTEDSVGIGGEFLEELKSDFEYYKKAFEKEVIDLDLLEQCKPENPCFCSECRHCKFFPSGTGG